MVVAAATITAAEQYMLELVNRARLDPNAEATRLGISLNQGLTANTLGAEVRQVLAPNEKLESAAIAHSQWMLAADVFSHTGSGGSTPGQRATAAGYVWNAAGENIAWQGSTAAINMNTMISAHHDALFKSAPHRQNILQNAFREVGIAQEKGLFQQGSTNFNASMVGQLFGKSGQNVFVTGVAYSDSDLNRFYTIGEAKAGITMSAQGVADTTETAGGYALSLAGGSSVEVTGKVGETALFTATVGLDGGNVKLDVVDNKTLYTSGDITLGTGINNARLLGMAALDATGNEASNIISGNKGANILVGGGGNDTMTGGAGIDSVFGGEGNDSIYGGTNNDLVSGGAGNDFVYGGAGSDRMDGGAGADFLRGGTEVDAFIFQNGCGADTIADFSVAGRESLVFDDALWGGATLTKAQVVSQFAHVVSGVVVFNFGDGDTVKLTGVTSLTGLSALVEII